MRKGLKGDPVADDVQVAFLAVGHDDTAEVKGHPASPRAGTVDSRPLAQVISPVAVSPTASPSSITRNSTASPRVGEAVCAGGRDRFRTCGLCPVKTSPRTQVYHRCRPLHGMPSASLLNAHDAVLSTTSALLAKATA